MTRCVHFIMNGEKINLKGVGTPRILTCYKTAQKSFYKCCNFGKQVMEETVTWSPFDASERLCT